jgi:thiol-disulfide isomerase/thioredoxin/dienelactone hydrolase
MIPVPRKAGFLCLITLALCFTNASAAREDLLAVELPSGQELEIQRFTGPGTSKSRILWLPSERGISKAHAVHAAALANIGHEVWLADLHDAYFIERDRRSISQFPLQDMVALISAAASDPNVKVILLGSSRGAQLALIAAREWQLQNSGKSQIKGLILVHAYLYANRPEVGDDAQYLPITMATNLPVYLLDAQYSTKSSRINELADTLGKGGGQVYSQVLPGVQGGFFRRDGDDLSAADKTAKRDYATTINRAIKTLEMIPTPKLAVAVDFETRQFSYNLLPTSALTRVDNAMPAPALSLMDMNQQTYVLGEQGRKVVLVNFWASWCRPCVEEIPSLHRLRDKIDNPKFEIITVNVGEDRVRIDKFLTRVPIQLPLLMDNQGIVSAAWKVYVYPSSYLVDHQGKIRYAYLGALEWDSAETIKIIQNLLNRL